MADDFVVKVGYLFDEAKLKTNAQRSTNIFGDVLRDFRSQLALQAGRALARSAMQGIGDMVQNVMELDKAQTELRKVSDLTGKTLDEFTEKAYKMGDRVAKTGTEIVQASTEFKKMGYSNEEALSLSEMATRFQNIADTEISAADAAKFINSQMKAFNLTANDSEHIIDAVNNVANNFAVGTNDLQSALTKTGAALSTAGNEFEQSIALVASGEEVLVGQSGKVARGLRSVAINIANAAKENEYFEAANGRVKVALQDSNGEMRSMYDVLTDLYNGTKEGSVAWDKLTETEQTAIASSLAGKTQFDVLTAVMGNYKTALEAVSYASGDATEANNAVGSSAEENEKYLDSIEGRLNNLQSAWEQLSYHVINSDLIKGSISFLTTLVKGLDAVASHIGAIPTMIGLVAIATKGLRGLAILTTLPEVIQGKGGLINILTGAGKGLEKIGKSSTTATKAITGNGGLIYGIKEAVKKYKLLQVASLDGRRRNPNATTEEIKEARKALGGITKAKASEELAGITSALDGLKSVLLTGGMVAAVTGLAAGLYALGQSMTVEHAIEKYNEVGDEIKNIEEQIASLEGKGDSLTGQEETQLAVLKQQLEVLKQQEKYRKAEISQQFQKEAESEMGSGKAGDQDNVAEKYIKARERVKNLEQEIADIKADDNLTDDEKLAKISSLSKDAEQYYNLLVSSTDELIAKQAELDQVDYSSLGKEGKAYYDSIHSAYLQMATDNEEVQQAIQGAIDLIGSDKFDSWELDISSLENADAIIEKLKDEGVEVPVDFISKGEDKVKKDKKDISAPSVSEMHFNAPSLGTIKKTKDEASKDTKTKMSFTQTGLGGIIDKLKSALSMKSELNGTKKATGKRKGEQGGTAWLGDEGSSKRAFTHRNMCIKKY